MSRGAFRMIYRGEYDVHTFDTTDDGRARVASEASSLELEDQMCSDTYIPAHHVVSVTKYEDQKQHRRDSTLFEADISDPDFYYYMLFSVFKSDDFSGCTCEAKDALSRKISVDCSCELSMFPLYEVECKNFSVKLPHWSAPPKSRSARQIIDDFVPPTLTYILHPSEREHMERWLAGTDDPLYDLVHELRHNPAFAPGLDRERLLSQEDLASGGTKRLRTGE